MPQGSEWARALEGYYRAMQAANRSPGTIRLHRHYLGMLRGAHPHPWRVTTSHLTAMIARPGWSAETKKSARSVFRSFYRWAYGSALVDHDPALALPTVYVPPAPPRPTPDLVARRVVKDPDHRTRLAAMLAAYGALRAAEIAAVHGPRDWDSARRVLTIHGKGRKVRRVPIAHEGLAVELDRLDGWAMPNKRTGQPLTPGTVSRMLSEAMPGEWTAHTLRHRAATQAYRGTRDLLSLGRVLGHARPETTQRYVQLDDDALLAVMRAASVA